MSDRLWFFARPLLCAMLALSLVAQTLSLPLGQWLNGSTRPAGSATDPVSGCCRRLLAGGPAACGCTATSGSCCCTMKPARPAGSKSTQGPASDRDRGSVPALVSSNCERPPGVVSPAGIDPAVLDAPATLFVADAAPLSRASVLLRRGSAEPPDPPPPERFASAPARV